MCFIKISVIGKQEEQVRLLSVSEHSCQSLMAALENLSKSLLLHMTPGFISFTLPLKKDLKAREMQMAICLSVLCISYSQLAESQTFASNTVCQSHLKWMI